MSAVLVVITAAGLVRGVAGRAARGLATAGAVALVVAGARVGHSGGELVYRYGAASAYTPAADGSSPHVTTADTVTADTAAADSTAASHAPRLASSRSPSRAR